MSIITQLRSALKRPSSQELEQLYLGEATSAVDLELRQRELDRGKFRGRQPYY